MKYRCSALVLSAFCAFFLLISTSPAAAEVCDGVDDDGDGLIDEGFVVDRAVIQMSGNTIFRIDPVTGAPTVYAGPFGISNPNGLAAGRDASVVYALVASSNIYELNVETNATRLIANVGNNGGCSGLALDADGILWCVQRSTNQLVSIDPDTGVVTGVGTSTGLNTHHGGMAYSIIDDQLFMLNASDFTPASHRGILTMNRSTGLGSVLFNFSAVAGALAFDDENDVFYYSGGTIGGINTIDPDTGAISTLTTSNTANNLTFFNLSDAQLWYRDGDGDGFGDPDTALEACEQPDGSFPPGHVPNGADSDDTDPFSCRDADGDGVDDCIPWSNICDDPNGVEVTLHDPALFGVQNNDEGISDWISADFAFYMYGGASAQGFRVFANGLSVHRYFSNPGDTSINAALPHGGDDLRQVIAPFWADLENVTVCMLQEATALSLQWTGNEKGTGASVEFQSRFESSGVITFSYGPGHDAAASNTASIGIEGNDPADGMSLGFLDPGATDPGTGHQLTPDNPWVPSVYTHTVF